MRERTEYGTLKTQVKLSTKPGKSGRHLLPPKFQLPTTSIHPSTECPRLEYHTGDYAVFAIAFHSGMCYLRYPDSCVANVNSFGCFDSRITLVRKTSRYLLLSSYTSSRVSHVSCTKLLNLVADSRNASLHHLKRY